MNRLKAQKANTDMLTWLFPSCSRLHNDMLSHTVVRAELPDGLLPEKQLHNNGLLQTDTFNVQTNWKDLFLF